MSWFQTNITRNPMMAEVGRFQSVLKGKSASSMGIRAILALACLISGLIAWATLYSSGNVPPSVALFVCLGFCCLVIPLRSYGVIAGERERRSWELLRVAPVTHLQIAFGKFASIAFMVLLIHAVFFPTYALQAMTYSLWDGGPYSGGFSGRESIGLGTFISAELFSLAICFFVAALTLFFSARSRRSFTALALTLGTLASYYLVLPIFWATIFGDDFALILLNPFYALYFVVSEASRYGFNDYISYSPLPLFVSFGIVVVLTLFLIIYAAKTLHFADDLIKFLPKKS